MSDSSVIVPPDYEPEKDKGDFMNPIMREYFRHQLLAWRKELLNESQETISQTLHWYTYMFTSNIIGN